MTTLLTIDGRTFSVMVTSLTRSFRIVEGRNASDMQDGSHIRDLVGTYIDYEMGIDPDYTNTPDYDALYEILSAPVDEHEVTLPYGRNSSITYDAQISSGTDSLLVSDGVNDDLWGGLVVKFKAKKPQRTWEDEAKTTLTVQFRRDIESTHSTPHIHIDGILGSVDVYGSYSSNPPRYTLPVLVGETLIVTKEDMDVATLYRSTGVSTGSGGLNVTATNPTMFFWEEKSEVPGGDEIPIVPPGGGDDDGPATLF